MSIPVGYLALFERYEIKAPRPRHISWLGRSKNAVHGPDGTTERTFPTRYLRDDSDVGHLVFALKHDGVDLLALKEIFQRMDPRDLVTAISGRPTSKFLRRLWFFYEFLLGEQLPLDDARPCPYVDLLEPDKYYTRAGPNWPRQYVRYNLLGNDAWCPIVRRTDTLLEYEEAALHELARSTISRISPALLQRATRYLYTKETRSSFQLERALPSDRMERFVEALFSRESGPMDSVWWGEERFVELNRMILGDERFAENAYRTHDVRVSEQRDLMSVEHIHFIGAAHADVSGLMAGLTSAWRFHQLERLPRPVPGALAVGPNDDPCVLRWSCGDPFVDFIMAGCISFGFVYIHPFSDGNGRIHRLLLHHILAMTRFTPRGIVIPVSAAILHDRAGYDAALEVFSRAIMPFIEHRIDESDGSLAVTNDTADLYRYPDLTVQLEALCGWFQRAITEELTEELAVLHASDDAKEAMREVVELPDDKENLFLKICFQNHQAGHGYRIGKRKREKLFSMLSDEEITSLEGAIAEAFRDLPTR